MVAAYDLPKPTFRHEAYKDYKAGRAKAEPELISQMKRSREVFEAFGIPIYDKEGFEADDVLGTIVEQLKIENGKLKIPEVNVIIASGDMDTLQLVDDKRVQVYTLKKGINETILYDEEKVKERFGFGLELLPDYKGLRGDASDNIKGIAGIGEKTATELILNFGTIENLYKTVKKDRKKLLETGIKERIVELLENGKEDAEFSKILGTIRRDAPIEFSLPAKEWRELVSEDKVKALFTELEFRGLPARFHEVLSIANGKNETATKVEKKNGTGRLFAEDVPELSEAAIALWLINSSLTDPKETDILGFSGASTVIEAREKLLAELKEKGLWRVFEEIERPLISVVKKMEERGIKIDVNLLKDFSKEHHGVLTLLEKKIRELASPFTNGTEMEKFNIASPKQLGDVLFVKMRLTAGCAKKTATGAFSTKESELEKIFDASPIVPLILEYRELSKLLSTYIDNLPSLVAKDGRLHARFLQSGTTTGRMGCENPNLQNIPNQTELGRKIRLAFVAEKGFKLVAFDYSQMELRIAAFLSGDPKLIEIFKEGKDVHTAVASEVFGVSLKDVTKEMRRQAKVINFGVMYGMGVNSLRKSLGEGTTREQAQKFFDEYFAKFSGLAKYMDEIKADAYRKGFTETYFGRRRYHEGLKSPLQFIRASAERMAINAPMQGTGADIIKIAMARADEWIKKEKLDKDVFLLLQVHDELVYEVAEGLVKKVAPKIKEIMESILSLKDTGSVPMVVDASAGDSWGEMEKIESSK